MILLTGCAGFIGSRVAEMLLIRGERVVGVDDLNDYYDIRLKKWRLRNLEVSKNFKFIKADITNFSAMKKVFKRNKINVIYNLAARAGVRASIENPGVYFRVNVDGLLNILELSRCYGVEKIIHSSSSSVYAGAEMPFREDANVEKPLSPYAASKRASELLCSTYNHLYGLSITVLRYFTVYGPASRPDMTPFKFIKLLDEGKSLPVYGDGLQERDFTYIDDIAKGTIKSHSLKGFQIINLGNNNPHRLVELIKIIEKELNKKAKIKYLDSGKADMRATWADNEKAKELLDWKPETSLEDGIKKTVQWYIENRRWIRKLKI